MDPMQPGVMRCQSQVNSRTVTIHLRGLWQFSFEVMLSDSVFKFEMEIYCTMPYYRLSDVCARIAPKELQISEEITSRNSTVILNKL